jgi:hypothetical protein
MAEKAESWEAGRFEAGRRECFKASRGNAQFFLQILNNPGILQSKKTSLIPYQKA